MTPAPTVPRTHWVEPAPGVRLWVEEHGDPQAPVLLLIMGAASSGLAWPDPLVHGLAQRHRVIRYDHRDTGRSTWSFAGRPYAIADLARDAVAVLDALGVERAHVAGMSLGGILVQLLVADHPGRLLSATVFGTCAASEAGWTRADGTEATPADLPPVDPRLIEEWSRPVEERDEAAEIEHRLRHWKLLGGDRIPFDEPFFRDQEQRVIRHTGHHSPSRAHALADQSGLVRTAELARNEVPFLVLSAPADPVYPPDHATHLSQVVGAARLEEIPGMGHALPPAVWLPLARAIEDHTARAAS
ncbi:MULTISPECIES: alpha/beta fold hydrolase [Streptomyces]|uniref:alpha/beta fold hydrolase n=1 Tax=Streptomyces TaxID=1883 RepID=UPI0004C12082|nr:MULTISPECIES: alpha/beta hydrolase [Streptomyces]MEE1725191.1 alpha/beta hydrolase [Streptomyces sp. JV186]RZE49731.1 alpha/beta hydrolase [Streptomyces albidoflavus]